MKNIQLLFLMLFVFSCSSLFGQTTKEGVTELTLDLPDPCEILSVDVVKNELDFIVYPNPNGGEFTIEIKSIKTQTHTKSTTTIRIYRMNGQEVFKNTIDVSSSPHLERISLSDLSNGVYFLTVESNELIATKKIIVLK